MSKENNDIENNNLEKKESVRTSGLPEPEPEPEPEEDIEATLELIPLDVELLNFILSRWNDSTRGYLRGFNEPEPAPIILNKIMGYDYSKIEKWSNSIF